MSLLGSALGRGLAGAGQAAASLADKYIDQDLLLKREQLVADIRRNSAVQQTKDIDAYQNDPTRRANLRTEDTLDADAKAASALRAKVNEVSSTELTDAEAARTTALAPSQAAAAGLKKKAEAENTPFELAPGQQRFDGKGAPIAENKRATSQEVQDSLYREGLKQKGGSGANKYQRMSEAGRLTLQELNAEEKDLAKTMRDKIAGGELNDDPKAVGTPEGQRYQSLVKMQQQLQVRKARLLADEGVIDGAEDAASLVAGGATPADIQASRRQAALIGGQYASAFNQALDTAVRDQNAGKQAAVKREAERVGDKDYVVDVGGQRTTVGNPANAAQAGQKPRQPGLLSRAWESVKGAAQTVGDAMPKPDPEAHAQAALASGDRSLIQQLLATPDGLSPDTLGRLRAALKS